MLAMVDAGNAMKRRHVGGEEGNHRPMVTHVVPATAVPGAAR